jgi:hypothetical protein
MNWYNKKFLLCCFYCFLVNLKIHKFQLPEDIGSALLAKNQVYKVTSRDSPTDVKRQVGGKSVKTRFVLYQCENLNYVNFIV